MKPISVWDNQNNAYCGSCDKCFMGAKTREQTMQMLRARGWHHSLGTTLGGEDYEALLCPGCVRDEHRRVVSKPSIEQDGLPFDWDALRVVKGSGIQSR